MVQLDIPATFAASQFFVDLARQRIKKEAGESGDQRPLIYYRYLFYSVFLLCGGGHRAGRLVSGLWLARVGADLLEQAV